MPIIQPSLVFNDIFVFCQDIPIKLQPHTTILLSLSVKSSLTVIVQFTFAFFSNGGSVLSSLIGTASGGVKIINLLTLFTSLLDPTKVKVQGTSKPPCGKSLVLCLAPVIWQVIVLFLPKKSSKEIIWNRAHVLQQQ